MEERKLVKVYIVTRKCPMCLRGSMCETTNLNDKNIKLLDNNPKSLNSKQFYIHQCDLCGYQDMYKDFYPRYEYVYEGK